MHSSWKLYRLLKGIEKDINLLGRTREQNEGLTK